MAENFAPLSETCQFPCCWFALDRCPWCWKVVLLQLANFTCCARVRVSRSHKTLDFHQTFKSEAFARFSRRFPILLQSAAFTHFRFGSALIWAKNRMTQVEFYLWFDHVPPGENKKEKKKETRQKESSAINEGRQTTEGHTAVWLQSPRFKKSK